MNRQPGYYWVKYLAGYADDTFEDIIVWTIAEWQKDEYDNSVWEWMRTGWDVGMQDKDFLEINENRIPAPNEEAGIDTLGRCIADLILSKTSFTWDAETNNITYKLKGVVKIASPTVTGGFDFGSDDKTTRTMNGANATDSEEGNKV